MIIDSVDKLPYALEFINGSDLLSYDTETSGLNVRKDHVIGFGVSNGIDGIYIPVRTWNTTLGVLVYCDFAHDIVGPILQALAKKQLLMFNASFDVRVTRHSLGVDLLPNLHTDVMLLKHTCDEEYPFGLKEISAKLWGHDVKKEKAEMLASIKARGGTTTQYFKADTGILAKYCIQDCNLTFRLYNYYRPELRRQGLDSFYYTDEVLPLYKEVTIALEETGIQVDIEKANQTLVDIDQDLMLLEDKIQGKIQDLLVPVFEPWFLNKDYPKTTTTGKVSAWAKKYKSQHEAWSAGALKGYMFNLLSKHHLKKLFFDTLAEEPLSRTPTGQPQVDDDFLQHISYKYDWVKLLIDYNKLTKLRGTYILKLLEEAEDGIFYPSFLQHRTVSGRYASDLQQLPRPIADGNASALVCKYTNVIRELLLPRTSKHKLVSADYEQLEPSIFAHTSTDSALQSIFNSGRDFYSEVAIRTEKIDASSNKTDGNYLGKTCKAARQKAKAYALGIAYGMTGYKLKFEIGCTQEEADKLVEDYLNAFPALKAWMHESKETAKREGKVRTQSGRIRRLPNAQRLWAQYGSCIEDDLELWKAFHKNPQTYAAAKADRKTFKNELNNAINFQVQGLAASIVNLSAIRINRQLSAGGYKAKLVIQIHDELVYDVPLEELEPVCDLIRNIMEHIMQLSVPLRTVPQSGNNFAQCK